MDSPVLGRWSAPLDDPAPGRPLTLARRLAANGAFGVEPVAAADWLRIAELVARYRDLPLGTVDASVVATAERLCIREIATVDRRHFTVVRPNHVKAFTLMP